MAGICGLRRTRGPVETEVVPKTPFRMFTHSKFQRRFVRSLSFLRCNFEGSDHHRRQVFARSASEQLQVIHCPVGKASPKSVIILRSLTKRIPGRLKHRMIFSALGKLGNQSRKVILRHTELGGVTDPLATVSHAITACEHHAVSGRRPQERSGSAAEIFRSR